MDSSPPSTFLTTTSLDHRKSSLISTKSPKQMKKKNKQIKVRYISNPMRVETCASKFRELVQELTGQDAVDLQPDNDYSLSDDHNTSPPPSSAEHLIPRLLHQEPLDDRLDEYYEPLDGDQMFLHHSSAGFSGYFSNGIYNVNDFGTIDSMR